MYDVYESTNFYRSEIWTVYTDNQLLALFIPISHESRFRLFNFFTQRMIIYGSFLTAADKINLDASDILLKHYFDNSNHSIYHEFRNMSDLTYLRKLFEKYRFEYFDYLNYKIPLSMPAETMLSRISKTTRRIIRKELQNPQLQIETVDSVDKIDICYRILQKSYTYNLVPLADKSLFVNAFKVLYPKNMIKMTLARYQDKYIATSVDLIYKDTLLGWYGGFDRFYSKLMPNEIIMWHLLNWGAENGYRWYDFGGAGKPHIKYGVRDFKAKFGGNLVNFGRFLYIRHPFRYSIGSFCYNHLRRIMHLSRLFNPHRKHPFLFE